MCLFRFFFAELAKIVIERVACVILTEWLRMGR